MSLAPDPRRGHATSPRTLNRWACCFGDPVNLVDVDGGWPDVGGWVSDRANDAREFWDKQVYGVDRTRSTQSVEANGVKGSTEIYQHTGGGLIVMQQDASGSTTGISLNTPSISIPGTKIKLSTSVSLRWGEKWGISGSTNYTSGDGPTSSFGGEVSHSGVGVKCSVSSKLPNIVGTTIGTRTSVGEGFSWPQIGYAAALAGMTVVVIAAVADNAVGVEGVDEAPAAAGWVYILRQLLSAPAFAAACAG